MTGRLEWGGQNFSESAQEVQFGIESENEVPILRALLKKTDEELSVWSHMLLYMA